VAVPPVCGDGFILKPLCPMHGQLLMDVVVVVVLLNPVVAVHHHHEWEIMKKKNTRLTAH
jgi:hypothetical protein